MPRDTGAVEWLGAAIRDFPREFLLFSSHVEQLVLDDRTGDGHRRVIELEDAGDDLWELHERGDEAGKAAWKLFTAQHAPSEAVKRDGGTMAERPVVPLHWAVPISRPVPGSLWAFFPTVVQTTLSGIINAPWKLDESRTTLVAGEFNAELLRAVVALVIDNLDAINRPGDPGYFLELFPGRGRELRGWADEILSEAVYTAAAGMASLPDQRGVLQPPSSLRVLPPTVSLDAAEHWAGQPTRPVGWVHPAAIRNATRRSRTDRLFELNGVTASTEQDWLEVLISRKSPRGSACAVKVAANLAHTEAEEGMKKARIILTREGKLARPVRGAVYRPAEVEVDVEVPLVAPELLEDGGVLEALEELRIAEVSTMTVLEAVLDRALIAPPESCEWSWSQVWELAAGVSESELSGLFVDKHRLDAADVFVKSMAGRMVRLSAVLLPGDLLAAEDFKTSHRGLLVDIDHHRRELKLLRRLGATDRPVRGGGSLDEPWLAEYRRGLIADAIDGAREHGARVKAEHYDLIPSGPWAGPTSPLDGLAQDAAARYARELLAATETVEPWTLRRTKAPATEIEVEHPILWRVRQLGVLPTDKGLRPIGDCVTPNLRALSALLPVADVPRSACRAFALPDTVDELDARRVALALEAFESLDRDDAIGSAYAVLLPVIGETPVQIRAMVRREATWIPPKQVCASFSPADLKVLRGTGTPFVRFESGEVAERFVAVWGLQRITDVVTSKVVAVPDGEEQPAMDLYPLLRFILGAVAEGVKFLPCRELHREMYTEQGSVKEPVDFELRDGIAYHLSDMSEIDRVRKLSERLGKPLDQGDAREVLENAQATEVQALLKQVRAAPDDARRLLLLVGRDALRSRIPEVVLDAVEETDGELDDVQTAELALTVFGIETLKEYRDALVERRLSPPSQWAGRRPAVRFVTEELNFPREYAGFPDVRLDDTLDVAGPSPLPSLHDFQDVAAEAIGTLIRQTTDRRGLLSLPTGAGKTRVAVEALIRAMENGKLSSPVLWVAQTEELCEQAVQSWAEVWRAVGPDRGLRVSRLWSGHTAAPRDEDGDQVVVATIAKLTANCMQSDGYDWLRDAGCVVVDEAHTSIAKSYTQLFRWTGIDKNADHAPLIGLSATPYRGVSVEQTDDLARRYGRTRLDDGIFAEEASVPLLQRKGILARVDHQLLEGFDEVPLSSTELDFIRTMHELPPSVLAKIGEDLDRTTALVESVMGLASDWPVFMFAASVAHAETLAALISRRGRSAAAISGETPAAVRRHLISEFRAGRLQTLTNYGVLTQGFDAPSIRALYIARPTYSPNLYQQMIGRGLRGPANGGKETCLVVDVADNLVAYGMELAFREFEYVWTN